MTAPATYQNELIQRLKDGALNCGSLGYHALQPDVEIESTDGSFAAHRNGMVIGDPLGDPNPIRALVEKLNRPDFLQIGVTTAERLQKLGYNVALMGVEARIQLPFSLSGESKSDLRRAKNRSQRSGVIVNELPAEISARFERPLERFNRQWLGSRKTFNREFTFLARPYTATYLPHERRLLAHIDGRIVGMACYDPVWTSGNITGYLESIIRTNESAAPGARDALTLSAIKSFQSEGAVELSLGLCPFHCPVSHADDRVENSPVSALLFELFYSHAQELFNSRGLAFHKSRYRPGYSAVYVASQRRSPFRALYRACQLSGIDPVSALGRTLQRFMARSERSNPRPIPAPALKSV